MRFFYTGKDGGPDSTVWGFWLIEAKALFSVALLCFENGSREAHHSHAFNSISWLLSGKLEEDVKVEWKDTSWGTLFAGWTEFYRPSLKPIITPRSRLHKVTSVGRSWVLTFRGPWASTWTEWNENTLKTTVLTDGRKVVDGSADERN